MAEGQVTVEGETRGLPDPFFVVATQNPHQFHGAYPLPEGQLDSFMVATTMGYPERRAELGIVRARVERRPPEEIRPVASVGEVAAIREAVRRVQVHEEVMGYAVRGVPRGRAGYPRIGPLVAQYGAAAEADGIERRSYSALFG